MQSARIFEFKGKMLTVRYDVKRCIHAKECVNGLPRVFDPKKRPWIQPDQADADELAAVIMRCPTGALHYSHTEIESAETTPDENTMQVCKDGPLYLRGALQLHHADGEILMQENRVALCRCGKSTNKPFCDNSHIDAGFSDEGALPQQTTPETAEQGPLKLTFLRNGPILVQGGLAVHSADQTTICRHNKTAFCRCGASSNKPYCDGTHNSIGFQAE